LSLRGMHVTAAVNKVYDHHQKPGEVVLEGEWVVGC
jgi:hypothetical protein